MRVFNPFNMVIDVIENEKIWKKTMCKLEEEKNESNV